MHKSIIWLVAIVTLFPLTLIADDTTPFETLTFPSQDGLTITADLYMPHAATAPFVLLFHQAGYSRGEYREIAPKLNAMGFNAMAIDQRSGSEVHGVINETAKLAASQGLSDTYIDALPDLLAAIDYVKANYATGKLILWGSSYSSCLVLKIGGDTPAIADGLLAFSPGEYYERLGLGATFIADSAQYITKPVFITSALDEQESWQSIYDVIPSTAKTYFLPTTGGVHGSSTLLESTPENQEYWDAVSQFLEQFKESATTDCSGAACGDACTALPSTGETIVLATAAEMTSAPVAYSIADSAIAFKTSFPCYASAVDIYLLMITPDEKFYFISSANALTEDLVPYITNQTDTLTVSATNVGTAIGGVYIVGWFVAPANGGNVLKSLTDGLYVLGAYVLLN